jgi:RHS repeat-associated protein
MNTSRRLNGHDPVARFAAALLFAFVLMMGQAATSPRDALGATVTPMGLPGLAGASVPGSCDPTMASCETPKCSGLDAALGKCKPGDPPPADPGPGGPGGGTCSAPPGGSPTCSGGGPAALDASGPAPGGGNPINLINGNKYQEETDLAALPGVLGLELKRYYNSMSTHPGLLGANWRMSYETVLYDFGSQIQIVQADGQRLTFQRGVGGHASLCSSAQVQDGQVRIEEPKDGKGQRVYHWRWPDGRTLSFGSGSGGGFPLQAITAASGQRVTLNYSPTGDLISIRDPQGRKLSFIYANASQQRSRALQAIDTPLGRLSFTQDRLGRLTEVASSKDAKSAPYQTKVYHYEDKYNGGHVTALTGISVRSIDAQTGKQVEQRLSTYAYNQAGQAILSTKGRPREMKDGKPVEGTGIEQIDVAFVAKSLPYEGKVDKATGEVIPKQMGKTILTNSLGQKTEVLHAVIGGRFRLIEMRGPGCSTCGPSNMRYAYDERGHLVRESRIDSEGRALANLLTRYDEYGRIVKVVRQMLAASTGLKDKGTHQPVEWVQRFEYADQRFKDSSVAIALKPSVIAQPSVVAGKELVTRIDYGPIGSLTAQLPVVVTQSGWSPTAGGKTAITRSMKFRYVESGPAAGEMLEVDGALPNGVSNTPLDSDVARYAYDDSGRLASTVYPTGLKAEFRYDELGRVIEQVPADGVRLIWEYDAQGRPASVHRGGVRITARWAVDGRLNGLERNDGKVLSAAPDHDAPTSSAADSVGTASATQSALSNAIGTEAHPSRVLIRFEYGIAGREAVSVVDANGVRTSRILDDFGRGIRTESSDSGTTFARYDEADRIVESVDADGRRTSFEYDPLGRVLKRVSRDKDAKEVDAVVLNYSGAHLIAVANFHQADGYEWDSLGRMVKKVTRIGGMTELKAREYAVEFRYDQFDRVSEKILPDGMAYLFTYGPEGDVKRISLRTSDGKRQWLVKDMHLDANGGIQDMVFGNDTHFSVRPQAQTAPAAAAADADPRSGLFMQAAHAADAQPSASAQETVMQDHFGYDGFGRLSEVQSQFERSRFAYDAGGNRTEAQTVLGDGSALTQSWQYVPGSHRIAAVRTSNAKGESSETLWEYDAAGNATRSGDLQYVYGANGRMHAVKRAGAVVAEYRYNGGGERVIKQVSGAGGVRTTTYFLYSANRIAAEADEQGRITAHYLYWAGRSLAKIETGLASSDSLTGDDKKGRSAVRVVFLHTDELGTPQLATDASQQVVWRSAQGAFGQALDGVGQSAAARTQINLRFPGQYFDAETGNHYNYLRDYDPRAGRYLQPDPLGIAGGLNVYAYAANDPQGNRDPLGLMPEPDDEGLPNPTLFGTFIHIIFAGQVQTFNVGQPGWGANDSRIVPGLGSTWPALRPDAYYVDPTQSALEMMKKPFAGKLWELKPIGWYWNAADYEKAKGEVLTYQTTAQRGCWMAGSSQYLVDKLAGNGFQNQTVVYGGKIWEITYINDNKSDGSGLLFYAKKEAKTKPSPVTVPAPALSKEEQEKLKKQMEAVKEQGAKEGWSGWEIAGMIVLIGLAIAALVAVAVAGVAAVIAAVVAAMTALFVAVAQGLTTLAAGLALLFGLGATAMANAAEKGKEKEKGLLDKTIDWFKSWF